MERRYIGREIRVDGEGDAPKVITGYAAIFYDGTPATEYVLWDDQYGRAVERIMPGAFDGALSRPDDVRGLFNHDSNMVLGRTKSGTMKLSVDAVGLKYEITTGDTAIAEDVLAHISRGDVSGSSFAFIIPAMGQVWTETTDASGRPNSVREIKAVELFDVGPVTFPAYEQTTTGVRAAFSITDAREARDAWLKQQARFEPDDEFRFRAAEASARLIA